MKRMVMAAVSVALMLLVGCGEKKCFFVSRDGKALAPKAPVVWYDAYVGRVDVLKEVDDGTKVSVLLDKKFVEEIRDGVAGRVVNDPKISPKAFVLLVGGRDKGRPAIEDGVQIPESKASNVVSEGFSAFVEWLKNSRADELKVVGVLLLIFFVILKFVSKMFKFVLFLGILAAIGYVCVTANIGWSDYKDRLANVKESAQEAKDWLLQHGERLHAILETALEADD